MPFYWETMFLSGSSNYTYKVGMEGHRPRDSVFQRVSRTLRNKRITAAKKNAMGRALIEAVKANDEDEVRRLLRLPGMDITYEDPDENNDNRIDVVSLAIRKNNIPILRKLLFFAIEKDLMDIASRLVNISDPETGKTPLIEYSYNEYQLHQLLSVPGINVNHIDNNGRSALNSAVANNRNTSAIKVLLAAPGIDLNHPDPNGDTPLMDMISSNYIDVTRRLLSKPGIDINHANRAGNTALIRAGRNNKMVDIFTLLLNKPGIDINHTNDEGNNVLMEGAYHGYLWVVEALYKKPGMNLNHVNRKRESALYFAVKYNHILIVRCLLKTPGIHVNQQSSDSYTPLLWAVSNDSLYIVEQLLNNPTIQINLASRSGRSPLILASMKGYVSIVARLLNAPGIEVNQVDEDGDSALMNAVIKGHIDVVNLLIRADRIDINITNRDRETAMSIAVRNNHRRITEILEALINPSFQLFTAIQTQNLDLLNQLINREGIDVNVVNRAGDTPLILAVNMNYIEAVARLLQVPGIAINYLINDRYTALEASISHNRIPITQLFLTAGADVNIANSRGMISLTQALYYTFPSDVIRIIAERTADIDYLDGSGQCPLQHALRYADAAQRMAIVRILIDRGANPQLGTEPTPYERAVRGDFSRALNRLLRHGVAVAAADLWRGYSRGDVALMNDVFVNEAEARFTSQCPVCLSVVKHDPGCMYMSHNCSLNPQMTYDLDLYAIYKAPNHSIYWCTICGRICSDIHRHYALSAASGPKAQVITNTMGSIHNVTDAGCKAQGGGGLDEKYKRMDALRNFAFLLNRQIGRITKQDAKYELVEAAWDAPLSGRAGTLERIHAAREFTIPTANFPPNIGNNNTRVYPPIAYPDSANPALMPIVHAEGMNAVGLEDVPNVVQFRHRMDNGVVNNHIDNYIGLDTLFRSLVINPAFGMCWAYNEGRGCTARLYPQELTATLQNATGLTPEQRATYQGLLDTYTRRFDRVFAAPAVGGGEEEPMFPEAVDAVCALPSKTPKSTTRRRRRNM